MKVVTGKHRYTNIRLVCKGLGTKPFKSRGGHCLDDTNFLDKGRPQEGYTAYSFKVIDVGRFFLGKVPKVSLTILPSKRRFRRPRILL